MRRRRRRRRRCPWHNRRCSPHMSIRRRPLGSWSNGWSAIRTSANLSYTPSVPTVSHLRSLCVWPMPRHNRGLRLAGLPVRRTPRHYRGPSLRMNNTIAGIIVPVQLSGWSPLDVFIVKDAPRTRPRLQLVRHTRESWVPRHNTDGRLWRRRRVKSRRCVDQSGLSPPTVPATRLPHPARSVHKYPMAKTIRHPAPRIR
jgi:hypothetical protein